MARTRTTTVRKQMDPKPRSVISKKKQKEAKEQKAFERRMLEWASKVKESKTPLTNELAQCFGSFDLYVDGKRIASSDLPRMDTLEEAGEAAFKCAGAVIVNYFMEHKVAALAQAMNTYVGDISEMKATVWYDRLKAAFTAEFPNKKLVLVICVAKVQNGHMSKYTADTFEQL